MNKEEIEFLSNQYKEAIEYAKYEKDRMKSFKASVDAINTYNALLTRNEIDNIETFDLEEEDRQIIEYYRNKNIFHIT